MTIPDVSFIFKVGFIQTVLGDELPTSTLRVIQIFFDTATFDNIEKDKKVKLEAQVSLIGGTMGLLTGFSIISGVEIIYFAARAFIALIAKHVEQKKDPQSNKI